MHDISITPAAFQLLVRPEIDDESRNEIYAEARIVATEMKTVKINCKIIEEAVKRCAERDFAKAY